MILFLTLCYVAVLFLAVKLGWIRWTLWWKISPAVWFVGLLVVLFVPMQWGAPAGPTNIFQYTIEISPNVSGEVIEVPIEPLQHISKGEVLFRLDPVPFQAAVDDLEARLKLAKIRLADSASMVAEGAASIARQEKFEADVDSLTAQLDSARWDLEQTVVRAPEDGQVVALALRPGQRVSKMVSRSPLAFTVQTQVFAVMIPQSRIRFVAAGQEAEVVLKSAPGRTLRARVYEIVPSTSMGQIHPSGMLPVLDPNAIPEPFGVRLVLEPGELERLDMLPRGGMLGTAAIYTERAGATHLIRKVMLRMEAWMNYVRSS
jgi:multidrug resistance efflux pump